MANRVDHPTLSRGIEGYLDHIADEEQNKDDRQKRRNARTVKAYKFELRCFQDFVAEHGDGDPLVSTVRWAQVCGFHTSQKVRPSTLRRRMIVLRHFLHFALTQRWLQEDLAKKIELPKPGQPVLGPVDAGPLIDAVVKMKTVSLRAKRDKAFVLFLMSSGARLSDVLRLDRSDWQHNRAIVLGRGGHERKATLTTQARKAVDVYLAVRRDVSPALFIGLQPASRRKPTNRLTSAGARFICAELARDLKQEHFTPQQLRFATGLMLQEAYGDARIVAEVLGYSRLASVAVYRRMARRALEEAGV